MPGTGERPVSTACKARYADDEVDKYNQIRSDIIQTFDLETQQNLEKFCLGLQKGSPVDSYVTPIPSEFPGYPHDEIMAAGTFTLGSTIELTADAPVVAPYTIFMQGGVIYEYAKLGVLSALSELQK